LFFFNSFIYSPHKLPAHRAEGGLFEEGGCELMVFDEVNLGLFHGSSPSIYCEEAIILFHGH